MHLHSVFGQNIQNWYGLAKKFFAPLISKSWLRRWSRKLSVKTKRYQHPVQVHRLKFLFSLKWLHFMIFYSQVLKSIPAKAYCSNFSDDGGINVIRVPTPRIKVSSLIFSTFGIYSIQPHKLQIDKVENWFLSLSATISGWSLVSFSSGLCFTGDVSIRIMWIDNI